ncbi:MAG: hypothetical protein AAGI52_06505 [Bacteroidota bacterium]
MAIYLLTWNPKYFRLAGTIAEFEDSGYATDSWRTQSRRIVPGDQLLLLRQGTNRGIVGLAVATGAPEQLTLPWDEGRARWYVPLEWERIQAEPFLPMAALRQRFLISHNWQPRCSGTLIPEPTGQALLIHIDLLGGNDTDARRAPHISSGDSSCATDPNPNAPC